MFHYRNHGAADGRVAALQIPAEEQPLLAEALEKLATHTGMKLKIRLISCF